MRSKYRDPKAAQKVFESAQKILNFDRNLLSLMQNGPLEVLNMTEYTQPAMLLDGYVNKSG